MGFAIAGIVVVIAAIACGLLAKSRNAAQQALVEARAENQQRTAERDEARTLVEEERHRTAERIAERDEALALFEEERRRVLEASAALSPSSPPAASEEVSTEPAETLPSSDEPVETSSGETSTESVDAPPSPEETPSEEQPSQERPEEIDRCWPLVLADLTRRWAATVGVPPDARTISDGPTSAQLTEGLARETERLREEVGVDVSFSVGEPVEPTDPVVFLLTATDLLGAMASRCERMVVELDAQLVLTGEVWSDLGDDLETSRTRAVAAGAHVEPVEVGEDRVRVALQP